LSERKIRDLVEHFEGTCVVIEKESEERYIVAASLQDEFKPQT